ncbi:MAG: hypothetical protein ACFCVD_19425 [Nodosilinea sp.]
MVWLTWATLGCAKPTAPTVLLEEPTAQPNPLTGQLAEVSPPETLETLKQIIDAYTPQVRILSPRPGEILEDTTVSVRLQVRGVPIFKDDTWQLGPHIHVFLDNEPYRAVYDLAEPVVFENLAPGTHTLRVFASRPWHESFKNQGAFDQRTFHVYAQTPQNELDAKLPLLTYSRPQGTYGAEPIMLDFYLTNAPLHISAQDDPSDDLHDWRIRCTVNGQSFVFDQWQPIYLKGFKPGRNWVQLELIDEAGRPIDNRFNNTVRIIDYQPGGDDTLSRLVRGELDLRQVAGVIDPTYVPPVPPVTEPDAATVEAEPMLPDHNAAPEGTTAAEPPEPTPAPVVSPQPAPAPVAPQPEATPTPTPPEAAPPAAEDVPPLEEATPNSPPRTEETNPTAGAAIPQPPDLVEPQRLPSSDELSDQDDLDQPTQPIEPEPTLDVPSPNFSEVPAGDSGVLTEPEASSTLVPRQQATPPKRPKTPTTTSPSLSLQERFKQWRNQQKPPEPPALAPAPQLDIPAQEGAGGVVTAPAAPTTPETESPTADPAPALPRVMPEQVEPDLTEPDLTEPRESRDSQVDDSEDQEAEADTPSPGSSEKNGAAPIGNRRSFI